MPHLLDLPIEIISKILENLHNGDKTTLLNVCLVGSHCLLDIARPLTFRDIEFNLNLDVNYGGDGILEDKPIAYWEEHTLKHFAFIRTFISSPLRASAVRSIRLRVSKMEEEKLSDDLRVLPYKVLGEIFSQFTNATDVYLCATTLLDGPPENYELGSEDGEGSNLRISEPPPSCPETESFVYLIMQSFPALTKLYLDEYSFPMEDHQIITREDGAAASESRLKELRLQNCCYDVAKWWTSVQNFEVIELHGGKIDQHDLADSESYVTGAEYLLNEGRLRNGKLDRLRRLYVCSEEEERGYCEDIEPILKFFESITTPLSSLTDLVLRLSFTINDFYSILTSVSIYMPHLQRLMVELGPLEEFSSGRDQEPHAVFLDQTMWSRMEKLQELWLPLDSFQEGDLELITGIISNLKSLTHLYLSSPGYLPSRPPSPTSPEPYFISSADQVIVREIAMGQKIKKLAEAGSKLEVVQWDDTAVYYLIRNAKDQVEEETGGARIRFKKLDYVTPTHPKWQRMRKPEEWWL